MSAFRQIHMKIGEVKIKGVKSAARGAYNLKVDAVGETITIMGHSVEGVFHGVQSLLSLSDLDGRAPEVTINDAPRYEYRGMHIDVARNFMPKEQIMELIDAMAMYKLNKLHLHLTDDEGWRLEIPGLPELTEVSGNLDSRIHFSFLDFSFLFICRVPSAPFHTLVNQNVPVNCHRL